MLYLIYAATSAGRHLPTDPVAHALTDLGWREGNRPIEGYRLRHLEVAQILLNVAPEWADWRHTDDISPVAAALAQAALTP